jgi:glutathione gamma-glutamylcysteinyltransferase
VVSQARFKYPPHWVPLPMLYEAMSRVDQTTGQPRGFLRLSANTRPDSVLFTLDIRPDGSWREAEHFIKTTAPELVQVRVLSVVLFDRVCWRCAV